MLTIAITGTNGKTSTCQFMAQMATAAGVPAMSIGTMGVRRSDGTRTATPWAPSRRGLWARELRLLGSDAALVAVEAHSVSLAADEWLGAAVDVAVLTPIDRDHIDHHGSHAAYVAAKLRLFTQTLGPGGTAVLGADSVLRPVIERKARGRACEVMTVGPKGGRTAEVAYDVNSLSPHETHARISYGRHVVDVIIDAGAAFLAGNAALAVAALHAAGVDVSGMLHRLTAPPGRMQFITDVRGAAVIVDYAHTPGALEAALCAAREIATGRVFLVMGCGGQRDTTKRPVMGRVADALADVVIITDDNPRGEDAAAIRAAIRAGCERGKDVPERGEAIDVAFHALDAGDVCLVTGKGHERTQQRMDRAVAWSDIDACRSAAARLDPRHP